jgi:hypothetical protein
MRVHVIVASAIEPPPIPEGTRKGMPLLYYEEIAGQARV